VRYGQAAGFSRSRLVPHFVPSLGIDPAELPRMATVPSDQWRVLHEDGTPAAFDEFLMQSSTATRCWSSRRASARSTRVCRGVRARIAPELAREGTRVRGRVSVANEGDTRWLRGGGRGGPRASSASSS
jgi:hypothetical protein